MKPEGRFPTGKERKRQLNENEESRKTFAEIGARRITRENHYSWLDSGLDNDGEGRSFGETFRKLLPSKDKSLKKFIESRLGGRNGVAVGIEFGGVGKRLFQEFSEGFFKKSLGVTLVDHRPFIDRALIDLSSTHKVMEGDILSEDTYNRVADWGAGDKVDLIIERMGRGLEFIPSEPYTVFKVLGKWYSMLNEGGLMILQVPRSFNDLLVVWGDMLNRDYGDVLDFHYNVVNQDDNTSDPKSSFRLQKLEGAPAELPSLDHKTIRLISTLD